MSEQVAAKTVSRLPANIYYMDREKNHLKIEIEKVIANIAKKGEIKDTDSHKKDEIAKRLLLANFRSFPNIAEIPAEFDEIADSLEKPNAFAAGLVKMHNEIKVIEEEKEKSKKQQAQQEKEAEQARKAEEDKAYLQAEADFEQAMISAMPKIEKTAKKITEGILKSIQMPSSVAMTGNGMGLAIASNASKAEIAAAITTSISVLGSIREAEGALQFQIGDAVNAAVKNGVYRKKKDAADHIKLVILEKCNKDYHVGHIQTCALMAERVNVEKRQRGVAPSKYLLASKLTAPRIKDSDVKQEEAESKASEFRDELIEEINKGVDSKVLAEKIQKFKEDNNFVKKPVADDSAKIKSLQNDYVWAELLISLTVEDEITVVRAKDKKTYTTAELVEIRDNALAELRKIMLEDKYDVKALRKGVKDQMVKGEMKEAPYRLVDPLWKKETPKTEPEQVPVEEVEAKEEEEEVAEEVEVEEVDTEDDSEELETEEESEEEESEEDIGFDEE